MDLIEAIKIIAETPIPIMMFTFGIILIATAMGTRFRAIINTSNVNKIIALITGIFLTSISTIAYIISTSPEASRQIFSSSYFRFGPFFLYYLISVLIVVPVYYIVLKFNEGDNQVKAISLTFILCSMLITITVIWRVIKIWFYLNNHKINKEIPYGLYSKSNYLWYFLLLGIAIITTIWIILTTSTNYTNRNIIFRSFIIFLIYIALCRLAWEFIDDIAETRIPNPQNINLNTTEKYYFKKE